MNGFAPLLALSLWVLTGPQDDKQMKEEAAKKKIEEFKAAVKTAKSESEIIVALGELGKLQHPLVLKELKNWLGAASDNVAVAAAEQIGKYLKDRDAAETLLNSASSKKAISVTVSFIGHAGNTGCKGIASRLIALYTHRELDVIRAAVEASGKIKSKACIPPLISLVKEVEAAKQTADDAGAPGYRTSKRKIQILQPALDALRSITGQTFTTGRDWDAWWAKNGEKFKEPD